MLCVVIPSLILLFVTVLSFEMPRAIMVYVIMLTVVALFKGECPQVLFRCA
jgi:hypothetical protein